MATARSKSRTNTLPSSNGWADSAEEWRGRNLHKVVMPSGAKAIVSFPELGPLVLANAVPDDLIVFARKELTEELGIIGGFASELAQVDENTPEGMERAKDLTRQFSGLLKWLVAEHVLVEPKITVAELSEETFPLEDLDWLYGVATRRVNEDALGRRLGVARLDALAPFPETHGCAEDCSACLEALQKVSTAYLGEM